MAIMSGRGGGRERGTRQDTPFGGGRQTRMRRPPVHRSEYQCKRVIVIGSAVQVSSTMSGKLSSAKDSIFRCYECAQVLRVELASTSSVKAAPSRPKGHKDRSSRAIRVHGRRMPTSVGRRPRSGGNPHRATALSPPGSWRRGPSSKEDEEYLCVGDSPEKRSHLGVNVDSDRAPGPHRPTFAE